MNYEIERKLNDKVDKWELYNLQNEIRSAKSEVNELEKRLSNSVGEINNLKSALAQLMDLLMNEISIIEQGSISNIKGNYQIY
jgi:predicted  nucleic acid-binding Zn-ribbon protein